LLATYTNNQTSLQCLPLGRPFPSSLTFAIAWFFPPLLAAFAATKTLS